MKAPDDGGGAQTPSSHADLLTPHARARCEARAANITIVRDDWGIAHVHGKTDADAVFGAIYAQAEDDFGRIEGNYLAALGRTAEVEGETAVWRDLRQRLFIDPADLAERYAACPPALRALIGAWADGLNYYLATHPHTRPRRIARFAPWMALSFTEGANTGDVDKVSLADLAAFYGAPDAERLAQTAAAGPRCEEPSGSNGIAIAPVATKEGHALLLINPHTAFFLRSELQMSSDEGLNAYGSVSWGQFFVYQGFNSHAGWMHTTSTADCVDEFAERIERQGDQWVYRHGDLWRPVHTFEVALRYRTSGGDLATKTFEAFRTHHGPIVRAIDRQWIAAAMMDRPVEALEQSFRRMKAADLTSFIEVAGYAANSSNNTVFASDKGEIALLSPQFIPLRDDRFDYTQPVDGSDPATDWQSPTPLADLPSVVSPPNGWVYNANDGPWWAAGDYSSKRSGFPRYMDQVGANPRTAHVLDVLKDRVDFTVESLLAAAYDSLLPTFVTLLPGLIAAYEALAPYDSRKVELGGPVDVLRNWDCRWAAGSVATALAVSWGDLLWASEAPDTRPSLAVRDAIASATPDRKLAALTEVVEGLTRDYGDWRVVWGDLNRFQRLNAAAVPSHFDDREHSWPVPFTSSQWGSLAVFSAKPCPGSKKLYGVSGNSFVAVVEFGPRVRAVAISAGGASGDPGSQHFTDQAERYSRGELRAVYFHPDELVGHVEQAYYPGQPHSDRSLGG